jgi:hypothetical protein
VAIARQQGARWLELRAARAYADFLVHADRPIEARNLLQQVVAWFTEGKDSMDFAYTEALLRTLDTVSSHR